MHPTLFILALAAWCAAALTGLAYYVVPRYRDELMQVAIWFTVCSVGLLGWMKLLPEARWYTWSMLVPLEPR